MKQWELENAVGVADKLYVLDKAKIEGMFKTRPWKTDPRYFKSVKMSALALIKIVMHAKTGQGKAGKISQDKGNWIEVMGLMQGYVDDNTFVVLDSFALPVDATEVEVSMTQATMEYMIKYLDNAKLVGHEENVVGWYHSHPGYSCFLSGVDVNTQLTNQKYQDPWISVVVDPVRTIATGKVEIKAFRTYPEGYVPDDVPPSEYQSIPTDKMEEFGAHANKYYEVPIQIFRSTQDTQQLQLLWNKYWAKTLSSSPLVANRFFTDKQLRDVAEKLEKSEHELSHGSAGGLMAGQKGSKAKQVSQLSQATRDSDKVTQEVQHGLFAMVVKHAVFNAPVETVPETKKQK
jgi:COP9 signalosome complex subunit 5